jgi:hypothetical protein
MAHQEKHVGSQRRHSVEVFDGVVSRIPVKTRVDREITRHDEKGVTVRS